MILELWLMARNTREEREATGAAKPRSPDSQDTEEKEIQREKTRISKEMFPLSGPLG